MLQSQGYPETSSLTGTGKVVNARAISRSNPPQCEAATDCPPATGRFAPKPTNLQMAKIFGQFNE
jgi:hypothetical protein